MFSGGLLLKKCLKLAPFGAVPVIKLIVIFEFRMPVVKTL